MGVSDLNLGSRFLDLSLIHISEPTRRTPISYAVFCLKKKINRSLGEAMIIIAKLGGYLNRKCDGVPGFESMWRGYARFYDICLLYTSDAADE